MQQDCRHTVKDVNPTQIAAKLFGCLDKENMRIKKEFILRDVAGKKAIFCRGIKSIDFRRILVLKGSAEWVWQEAQAQGDFTIESLTARACEEFDTTPQEAEAFVTEFLEQ